MARAPKQVPGSDAGPVRVNMGKVYKAAQQDSGTRKAMTGVPGSGPVGSDSRPGSFRNSLDTIKQNTPPTAEGILKDTNRAVRTGSGRTKPGKKYVGDALTLDAQGKGPRLPPRSDPVEPNDMHSALKRMITGSTKPGIQKAAAQMYGTSDRAQSPNRKPF